MKCLLDAGHYVQHLKYIILTESSYLSIEVGIIGPNLQMTKLKFRKVK